MKSKKNLEVKEIELKETKKKLFFFPKYWKTILAENMQDAVKKLKNNS